MTEPTEQALSVMGRQEAIDRGLYIPPDSEKGETVTNIDEIRERMDGWVDSGKQEVAFLLAEIDRLTAREKEMLEHIDHLMAELSHQWTVAEEAQRYNKALTARNAALEKVAKVAGSWRHLPPLYFDLSLWYQDLLMALDALRESS